MFYILHYVIVYYTYSTSVICCTLYIVLHDYIYKLHNTYNTYTCVYMQYKCLYVICSIFYIKYVLSFLQKMLK